MKYNREIKICDLCGEETEYLYGWASHQAIAVKLPLSHVECSKGEELEIYLGTKWKLHHHWEGYKDGEICTECLIFILEKALQAIKGEKGGIIA